MKKFVLNIILFTFAFNSYAQLGAFKIRNDAAVQIGYNNYRYLSFGACNGSSYCSTYNNGSFALERWNGGFNIWKPWPTYFSGNYLLYIHDFGQVGIGLRANEWDWTNRLQVKGKVKANGYNTWSDERLKENINPYSNALEKVLKLKPITYTYKLQSPVYGMLEADSLDGLDSIKIKTILNDNHGLHPDFANDIRIGFKAQELEQVIPEVVETDNNGWKSVNYQDLIPVLCEAIKEQNEMINELHAKVNKLESIVESLNYNAKNEKGIEATLYQNSPNPFNNTTSINYEIISSFTSAKIVVYDFFGAEKVSHEIYNTGSGTMVIESNSLVSGTYHYILLVDEFVVDSKIMFLIK